MDNINIMKTTKPAEKRKPMNFKKKEALLFYGFISPFLLMLVVLRLIPFGWGIVMSFTNYTGFNLDSFKFVGFKNYIRVFTDSYASSSLLTTLGIGVVIVPATLIIALSLALLLNNNIKGVGIFRTIYYFPSIIPAVATGLMWRMIYNKDGGLLNTMLAKFGVDPINWLGLDWCRTSLYVYMLWGAGGGILTYLAALKGVPAELYESASIDGANSFQKLTKITIPMISSVIFFNLVNGLIAAWQIMYQPVFLAGMGLLSVPYEPNYTYLVHVYQQIFTSQRFGYGLAMIWVIFALSIILTRTTFYTSKFWVYNENETENIKPKRRKGKGRAVLNA
jgi:multiple sugar transport system permease protein